MQRFAMKNRLRLWVLVGLVFGTACLPLQAQRGVGVRFGSDLNHFFRAQKHPLVDGWWSQLVFGPYYQAYFQDGGAQIGLNILYKNNSDKGFPNFPVIQRDLKAGQNIGITALELDLKVGPRFGLFNPKIGANLFYCFKREGFLEDGETAELNRTYFAIPFGLSIEGPTGYGSVGFSVYYNIGFNNVIKAPTPGLRDYDGSKIRTLRIELFVLFQAGSQKAKSKPKIYDPETGEEINPDDL